MKLNIYTIINNTSPTLFSLKEINVNKKVFEYEKDIVNMLREKLCIDKMDSEFIYALGLSYSLEPKGMLLLGVGNNTESIANFRGLATGLLLTGAEQFYVFHNHPGKNKKPSVEDIFLSNRYNELGKLIGIHFIKHIMIAGDYYTECI